MANLAIRGHATRGKEVIELLEMLGGKNTYPYFSGNDVTQLYYIRKVNNEIVCSAYTTYSHLFECYTLEEFIEKFPYKIWDKVQHNGATSCGSVFEVEKIKWVNNHIQYTIKDLLYNNCHSIVTAEDLQPFKEQTMIEKLEQITLDIPDGYEFFGINDDNKVVLTKKQPQYPKTYEECCIIIGFNSDTLELNNPLGINKDTHSYIKHLDNLIDSFYKLIICRDAYWIIAGKQMGLDKPWEPDWKKEDEQKHCIVNTMGDTMKWIQKITNKILAFPTAEMRDAFYENFKELIEDCKEVL